MAGNYFKPGSGLQITMFKNAMQNFEAKQLPLPEFFAQFLHSLFVNPFTALSQNNVLAVVMFALILGITLVMGGERFQHIHALLAEALEVTMLIVGWIMRLAPLGIMALLIKLVTMQDVVMLATLANCCRSSWYHLTAWHCCITINFVLVYSQITPVVFAWRT